MPSPRRTLLVAGAILFSGFARAVVINEIHYNPPDNTVRQEFIELYNGGDSEADLTGWRLSGAVRYAFAVDTVIPPGGYLVVAEDPLTLQSTLGAPALGPYDGNLDSEGETVRLRDQNDEVVDLADYKVGFPWPVAANGNGPSIELIHPALDNSLGSSWRGAQAPTPGAPNSVLSPDNAPAIRKVVHTPQSPIAVDAVVITALVTDPDGVASVVLEYQVVAPGAYVPSHLPLAVVGGNINLTQAQPVNPAYQNGWVSVPMRDDGTGGDTLAGDGTFSVTLPARAHRTLVRYRISVEDSAGNSARVPYPDDASLNFAYFVYNGVPDYFGTPAATLEALPVYHLITRGEDYAECLAYGGADQISQGTEARFHYNWFGALVYDGVVYDNIRYRLRGANGRYHLAGKRSMRFRFNDGAFFQARDQRGEKHPEKWRTLTTGKGFDNRLTLTYGLNEALCMHLFDTVGVPSSDTHWIHWRVIDGAQETPDQWRGDFHGLFFVLETYDVRFLEAHGLEKGNLYKLINQTTDWQRQQRYQSAFGARAGRDITTIETQLDGSHSAAYISAHVNMDKWNRWHAMVEAVRHYDFWPSANKNMVYYFEPDYTPQNRGNGKLWILPWDTDASWGPTWNNGHDVVYNALFEASGGGADNGTTPELWPEYFNMVREVRDLVWQRDQLLPLITEFFDMMQPLERADSIRWKGAPADAGNYNGLGGEGAKSMRHLVADLNRFAFTGGDWPGGSVPAGGRAAFLDTLQGSRGEFGQLPATPAIIYTGTAGYPTDGLSFSSSAFDDPQGNHTFGAMEWRVSQIHDESAPKHDAAAPFKLEWADAWESGELAGFDATLHLPTTATRSGLTYRARVRHRDSTGRWSHWSAPVEFTTTLPDISRFLDGLVISEIMYHPLDPTAEEAAAGFTNDDDFEWIELRNVGPVTLNLTDLRLTKGIDFDFLDAAITSLAPGEFVLIVANRAAFEMRHGPGLPIAGEWESGDKLDNGGEQVKLSFGAGDPVIDFLYDDVPPWPTEPDTQGTSLTLIAPGSRPDPALATNWRSSTAPLGTPGTSEAGPFAAWMATQGETDPLAPFRSSPLANLLAYAVGADLTTTVEDALPTVRIVEDDGSYPALAFRLRKEAHDVSFHVEVSDDLAAWQQGDTVAVVSGADHDNGDGTVTRTVRTRHLLGSKPLQYLRLRVELE